MLRCTATTDEECPVLGMDVDCLPWREWLEEADDRERRNASVSEAFFRGRASAWGAAAEALGRMVNNG